MGKKGAKRKTRWRTLSISSPPGEEDEEEGVVRNGYCKDLENGSGSRYYDKNAPSSGYLTKSRRAGTGSTTSGYGSGGSRSQREDSSESPKNQQKSSSFNEDEYTRITTPRQDVLFKKGYLSQRKPWASTTSTSATPSTTESQSASHSTADGSETTEDQQIFDAAPGDYQAVVEPPPQISYGTYYDHASGYYYEYPMMLVGPAVPENMAPNVLAAMPCGPVPLRPIEWVNPAYVPKITSQQYCLMDYQSSNQGVDCASLVDVQGPPYNIDTASSSYPLPMNGIGNESIEGSASCTGSIIEEEPLGTEECMECPQQPIDLIHQEEVMEEESGIIEDQYISTLAPQPLHHVAHHHVMQQTAVPTQPYLYPGHYMYGPSMMNANELEYHFAKEFNNYCPVHRPHCCILTTVPSLPHLRSSNPEWSNDPLQRHDGKFFCGPVLRETKKKEKEEETETSTNYR